MTRLHRGLRRARARPTARRVGRIDQPFFLRRCLGDLKVEPSSRRVLHAALIQWCRNNCPEKLAGHLRDGITRAEVTKPARTSKIGGGFWGDDGEYGVRKTRVRALRWPCRRDEYVLAGLLPRFVCRGAFAKGFRIVMGLRILLAGMAVVDGLKGREGKGRTVNAMVCIREACDGWVCGAYFRDRVCMSKRAISMESLRRLLPLMRLRLYREYSGFSWIK